MSATRQAVNAKLSFNNASARNDLLLRRGNGYVVRTELVAALQDLQATCKYPLLVTSMHSDRRSNSQPGSVWGHGHAGVDGCGAADLWVAGWQNLPSDAIVALLQAIVKNRWIRLVGLYDEAIRFRSWVTWPRWQQVYVNPNLPSHVHVQAGPGAPFA